MGQAKDGGMRSNAMIGAMVGAMVVGPSAFAGCAEDLSGDGRVAGGDLASLLVAWGPCESSCPEDFDGDGAVDGGDLSTLLAAWSLDPPDRCGETGEAIFRFDAEDVPLGLYTEAMLEKDWSDPSFSNGVRDGRVSIVSDPIQGRSLEFLYPEGEYGTSRTGAQWKLLFDRGYDRVRLRYRLRFGEGFDFVRGGKLPGLIGGQGNTGGGVPSGTDGWSARMMWRSDGRAVQYVYHPDQPANFGEDMPWERDGDPVRFEPGRWYEIEHEISINTPGVNDGRIVGRIDGVEVLRREGMRFRDVDDFSIDGLYVSTFFGGSNDSWATTRDERVRFDDVEIDRLDPP